MCIPNITQCSAHIQISHTVSDMPLFSVFFFPKQDHIMLGYLSLFTLNQHRHKIYVHPFLPCFFLNLKKCEYQKILSYIYKLYVYWTTLTQKLPFFLILIRKDSWKKFAFTWQRQLYVPKLSSAVRVDRYFQFNVSNILSFPLFLGFLLPL